MTTTEHRRIIREYCDGLRERLLDNAQKFPSYWDGFEIRALGAYIAERNSGSANRPHKRTLSRMRKDQAWFELSL